MSALAWLFGLGFLALVGPLLFHLIRRTPKGEVQFSSLMFLRPTPPTLTRRSRLDNLLLLALRMAAVALIAAAFMRPFFNSNLKLDFADVPGRKIAVLIDTSASMKRANLWPQAVKKLESIVEDAQANDEVAIFAFDAQLQKQIGYTKKTDAANLMQKFSALKLEPSSNVSNLGDALVDIANRLLESQPVKQASEGEEVDSGLASKLQVIVVSDMQSGSSTSALQSFRWPENVKVRFEQVSTQPGTNATLELLPIDESDPQQMRANVLVRNSKDSVSDQFSVSWENGSAASVPFQVPAGSSKVLRVKRDSTSLSSSKLILSGDDAQFDNQFFTIPPLKQSVSIAYVGDESPNDPEGMLYYFKRALIETSTTIFDLQQASTASEAFEMGDHDFMVVTRPVTEDERKAIDEILGRGATLLLVLWDSVMLESTKGWTGVTDIKNRDDAQKDAYAMLENIDFSHPVFDPFAGSRFNDFTQIKFWDFLRPNLADNIQVLARFDDDTPAIWHQITHDKSDIYVMGFGWQPDKCQLALSSKFLPLMMQMIELATKTQPVATNNLVGDVVSVPTGYDRMVAPDGSVEVVESASAQRFTSPGIHSFRSSTDSQLADLKMAVNISPSESQIDTMPVDQISALGVEVGTHDTTQEEVERERVLRDFELENRQKLWKWLVVGAIVLIIAESWLAGTTDRRNRSKRLATAEGLKNE